MVVSTHRRAILIISSAADQCAFGNQGEKSATKGPQRSSTKRTRVATLQPRSGCTLAITGCRKATATHF